MASGGRTAPPNPNTFIRGKGEKGSNDCVSGWKEGKTSDMPIRLAGVHVNPEKRKKKKEREPPRWALLLR